MAAKKESGLANLSGRERALGLGVAALLGYTLLKGSTEKIVGHPEEEFGHRALHRHEEQLKDMHGGLGKVVETLERLEKQRVEQDAKDRIAAEQTAKANEEARRAFWQKERAESDARQAETMRAAIAQALTAAMAQQAAPPRRGVE